MSKKKLFDYTVETWDIDSQYPDGSPDEKGMVIGLRKNGTETHAKGVFHITEKDGKLTAVLHLDRLAERNIPVYIDVGCKRILVQA